jgi:hypothetical protein
MCVYSVKRNGDCMKRLLCFLTFLVGAVTASNGATLISGGIDGITFDVSKNPYIVEKDIIVPKGKSVVIPEGIVLLFNPFTGFQIFGRLVVQGSGDRLVVFTSINDNIHNPQSEQLPNPFDWNGIFVSKDADGAFLNHFSLKYSVYGVKSQCKNIIIQNAVFQQNGQFHFTVNEQIQMVQDNIPFSYGDSTKEQVSSKPEIDNPPVRNVNKSTDRAKKVTIIRYTSLGVGVVGGVAAAICAVKMDQNRSEMQRIYDDKTGDYDFYKKKYNTDLAGLIVSGALGGLGLVGFGVSFAF